MNRNNPILDFLIAPHSQLDFITEYWETKSLYIPRNDLAYYSNILTIEQMNEFLSRNDIRYPTIRMAKNGAEVPLSDYSNIISFGKYAAEGLINIDKLFNCYYNGATIVHQLMKYSINSLSAFTNSLEKHFGFNVETTVYLTPEKSQGFTAHYDTHSVFILQVYGSTTWRLYDVAKDLPTLDQSFINAEYIATEPSQTIELLPGDLLYVPRGLAHDAITTDGVSLHITLGVFPNLFIDLFKSAVSKLKENIDFRKAPIDYIVGNTKKLQNEFNLLLDDFISKLDEDELIENNSAKVFERQMKNSHARLMDYIMCENVTINTRLSKRPYINFKTLANHHEFIVSFYGKKIHFPLSYQDPFNFCIEKDIFRVEEIEGTLNNDDKIGFCNKLISEGFLQIIDQSK